MRQRLGLTSIWFAASVSSGLIFVLWLAGTGWRWDGYPCFYWQGQVIVRYTFLAAYVAVVIVFVEALRRSALRPQLLDGRNLVAAMACFVVLRVILAGGFPLTGDEAYHWLWSQKIDWCYYDHPGMLAWVCWPFRMLAGSTLAARGAPIVLGTSACGLIWYLADRITGDRAAANRAVALAMILPVGFVGTVFLFTDAPMIVFWLIAIYLFIEAVKEDKLRYWLALGVAMGLAFLCKFLAFGIVPYLGLVLILSRAGRAHLAKPGPYLAVLVGAAIFTPAVIWNAYHDWQTFYFNFVARRAQMGFYPIGIAVFAARQIVLVGPVFLLWAFIFPPVVVRRSAAGEQTGLASLLACSYVPLIIYAGLKLVRPPYTTTALNWTAPLFPMLAVLFACYCRTRRGTLWLGPTLRSAGVVTVAAVVILLGTTVLGPGPARRIHTLVTNDSKRVEDNITEAFAPPAVAAELDRLYKQYNAHRPTFVMARHYMWASAINQYCRDIPFVLCYNPDTVFGRAFDQWNRQVARPGHDCLFVSTRKPSVRHMKTLRKSFETVAPADRVPGQTLSAGISVLYCRNMKAFPAPAPKVGK